MSENLIEIDPQILHGKPRVSGTRIPVYLVLDLLQHGLSFTEIQEEYPSLSEKDIQACILYAKKLVNNEELVGVIKS